MRTHQFRYCRVEIDDDARRVTTVFNDGRSCCGTREDNAQNRAEAEAEGYGWDVWRCLGEHELVHAYLAETLWDCTSPVLNTEAGMVQPYWLRMYEEALVLTFQIYLNTGRIEQPLQPFADMVGVWATDFRRRVG